ncbi:MAG: CRTAC1 family protein [Acidobacteriota bacterium]
MTAGFRRHGLRLAALALMASTTALAAHDATPTGDPPPEAGTSAEPDIHFIEAGAAAGVRVVHRTRDFGDRHKAEVLEMFTDGGAASAVGDPNGDGLDDLFVLDSGEGRPHHLFLNQGPGEDGTPRFKSVGPLAGVEGGNDADSICADALFFDYDDDGLDDLLIARFGTPLLFRNLGVRDGVPRFEDVSEAAGLTQFGNSIAVIAFDIDADGWLDLLFGDYFEPRNLLDLKTDKILPNNLDYADNGGGVTLWRNVPNADATSTMRAFVEVTDAAGLGHHTGWTLDVGHGDLDNDGDLDLYLAGDYGTDRLFLNDGDGTFTDVTEDALGFDTKKGMNVDMGDYDRNGFLDVYVTNITDEYMKECNMLWHNAGDLAFLDLSRETGTCDTDWGWAAKFADFDNDGWEDIVATNGLRSAGEANYIPLLLETTIIAPEVDFRDLNAYPDIGEMTWSGYQKQRLFQNLGDGTFKEVAAAASMDNDLDGRGLAVGDFDRDGRLDVYQTSARQPALLYINRSADAGHWLGVELEGAGASAGGSNRRGIGARVTLYAGDEVWLREVYGGNGYSSASTTRLHFGLGEVDGVDRIEVRWPNGEVEEITAPEGSTFAVDRYVTIREGRGLAGEASGAPRAQEPAS